MSVTRFSQLGLPSELVAALKRDGFVEPFPIQASTIPDALAGKDIQGKAPTGSGKTLAFGLSILATIERAQRNRPEALILTPTRELAEQIRRNLMPFGKAAGRYVSAVYGGVSDRPQKNELRRGVDLLIATPGRLQDLVDQGAVDLGQVEVVVIDEADRLADMGFLPDVRKLLDLTPDTRQTLLFSATLDGDVAALSREYQKDPVVHDVTPPEADITAMRHLFWLVPHADRIGRAADVIRDVGRTIVFTRTRHGADRLGRQLARYEVEASVLHGGKTQAARNRALKAFDNGKVAALIATDVAARGIHIDAVGSVVHFDPPADHKDYVHRSGRTARAGATGLVVSLVQPQQRRTVRRLQSELGIDEPIEVPDLSQLGGRAAPPQRPRSDRREKTREKRRDVPAERSERSQRKAQSRKDRGRQRDERVPNGAKSAKRKPAATSGNHDSVYVANLPWHLDEIGLEKLFSPHGRVEGAYVITDSRSGRSKGYGFVDMPRKDAERAIKELNGRRLEGRAIAVRFAKPRTYGG